MIKTLTVKNVFSTNMVRNAIASVVIAKIMEINQNVMVIMEHVLLGVKMASTVTSVICAVTKTVNISIVRVLVDFVSMDARTGL